MERDTPKSAKGGPWLKRRAVQAILVAWAFVCLFPVYWLAVSSVKGAGADDRGPAYIPFMDFQPTLESWAFILTDHYENLVWRFINSTIIGVTSSVLTVTIAAMAIYALTRFPKARPRLPRGWVMSGMLATRLLPPIVLVLPLYMMAQVTGTRDTLPALIAVYAAVNLPAALWLLQPVIGTRASEQEEAALLEGASHIRILVSIVFPMVLGSLLAVGLLVFMLCWNEYLFAAYLASDRAMTLPVWLVGQLSMKEAQASAEAVEQARLSAAAILAAAPLLAMTIVVQRFLGRRSVWQR